MGKEKRISDALLASLMGVLLGAGCSDASKHKAFDVDFDVQPSRDGTAVLWSLHFSREDFQALLDSTPSGADPDALDASVHERIRKLIAVGLESHALQGCSSTKWTLAKLQGGAVAFLGWCSVNGRADHANTGAGI